MPLSGKSAVLTESAELGSALRAVLAAAGADISP
jgi:hypothetical protein